MRNISLAITMTGFLLVAACDGGTQPIVDDLGESSSAPQLSSEFHGVWHETRHFVDIDGSMFDNSYFFIITDDGKYYQFDDKGDAAAAHMNRYQNCITLLNKGFIRQAEMENVYTVTLNGGTFTVSYDIEMELDGDMLSLMSGPYVPKRESTAVRSSLTMVDLEAQECVHKE